VGQHPGVELTRHGHPVVALTRTPGQDFRYPPPRTFAVGDIGPLSDWYRVSLLAREQTAIPPT